MPRALTPALKHSYASHLLLAVELPASNCGFTRRGSPSLDEFLTRVLVKSKALIYKRQLASRGPSGKEVPPCLNIRWQALLTYAE